jgi:eukaryotic-like serine/threonine-protein kinase
VNIMAINPSTHTRIEELFFAAIDLTPAAREEFLDRECAGDPALRTQVSQLLDSDDRAARNTLWKGSAIEAEARQEASDEIDLRIGQLLGPYRILRRLGAGGMGVVYEAVRDDKEFEKRVAIKLVQRNIASPEARDRLRAERQILANLDHPFIARLFDGGTTPEGMPYLVMELIEGRPLNQFARGLSRNTRLKLYLQICSAAAYAHRHLVVHRDLKPGNILVTPDGTPKLLDFGIAQLIHSNVSLDSRVSRNSETSSGGLALTPAYASPEQKQGLAGSVVSDVYSLGVLMRELIPEQSLEFDLASIVAKAVRENPAERYQSVDQLSEDVSRFMEGRTVLARPQRIEYRVRKFLGRRKTAVVLAAGLLVLAAVSAIVLSRSAGSARLGREAAVHQANTREFQPGGSLAHAAGLTTVRKSVDERSVETLERLLEETPGDENTQRELGTAYHRLALVQGTVFSANLGDRGRARATMEKALYLRERLFEAHRDSPTDRAAFVDSLAYLGRMAISDGEPSEAYRVHIRAWNESKPLVARGQLGEPLRIAARTEYLLGIDLGGIGYSPHLGDPAGALVYHTDSLKLLERWAKTQAPGQFIDVDIALRQELIAIDLARLGRFAEAEDHVRRAIAVLPREQPSVVTAGDPRTWCLVRSCYAWILTEEAQLARGAKVEAKGREALQVAREAVQGASKLVDADPANVRARLDLSIAEGVSGRATCLVGNLPSGTDRLDRVIDGQEKSLKVDATRAELRGALARHYLWAAACAVSSKNWSDADRRFKQAADLAAETVAAHSSDANARENLAAAFAGEAQILAHFGKKTEAEEMARKAAAEAQAILSLHPDNPSVRAILDATRTL